MIYFRGCLAREKLKNIAKSTETILDYSKIEYRVLENEECCGSFLLRTGFVDDAIEVMKKTLKKISNEKVIVSCAGCYKTFKKDYKDILGVEIEVIHTSQLFNQLLKDNIIELKSVDKKITYHDPCHLGRYFEEYDSPRNILSKTANLVEMKLNKNNSRCCGAGAGVRSAYPEITEEIAKMRIEDAKEVEAELIVTSCPFCILNLSSACLDDNKVLDISEIITKTLKHLN